LDGSRRLRTLKMSNDSMYIGGMRLMFSPYQDFWLRAWLAYTKGFINLKNFGATFVIGGKCPPGFVPVCEDYFHPSLRHEVKNPSHLTWCSNLTLTLFVETLFDVKTKAIKIPTYFKCDDAQYDR